MVLLVLSMARLRRQLARVVLASAILVVAGCSVGQHEAPLPSPSGGVQVGTASWYGSAHQGGTTSSGERFDQREFTAAHRTLPLGTRARVTNVANGRSVIVRINDRGPFVRGRVLDVSYGAARALGIVRCGTARVRIEVLGDPSVVTTGDVGVRSRRVRRSLRDGEKKRPPKSRPPAI